MYKKIRIKQFLKISIPWFQKNFCLVDSELHFEHLMPVLWINVNVRFQLSSEDRSSSEEKLVSTKQWRDSLTAKYMLCVQGKKKLLLSMLWQTVVPTMHLTSQIDLKHSICMNYACSHSHVHQVPFPFVKENITISLNGMFLDIYKFAFWLSFSLSILVNLESDL